MNCDSHVDIPCVDRDEDFTLTIYVQSGTVARDLTGLQAKLWIWSGDDVLIDGQVGVIGAAVTTPVDLRDKATGTGTPILWTITEAAINAMADLVGPWTYKARLSADPADTSGEVLAWGEITIADNARPR